MTTGNCYYGAKCHFAHGEHQLRRTADSGPLIHPRHKTTLCQNELRHGTCKFGKGCIFIHKNDPEYNNLREKTLNHQNFLRAQASKQSSNESEQHSWNPVQVGGVSDHVDSTQASKQSSNESKQHSWNPVQVGGVSDHVDSIEESKQSSNESKQHSWNPVQVGGV